MKIYLELKRVLHKPLPNYNYLSNFAFVEKHPCYVLAVTAQRRSGRKKHRKTHKNSAETDWVGYIVINVRFPIFKLSFLSPPTEKRAFICVHHMPGTQSLPSIVPGCAELLESSFLHMKVPKSLLCHLEAVRSVSVLSAVKFCICLPRWSLVRLENPIRGQSTLSQKLSSSFPLFSPLVCKCLFLQYQSLALAPSTLFKPTW